MQFAIPADSPPVYEQQVSFWTSAQEAGGRCKNAVLLYLSLSHLLFLWKGGEIRKWDTWSSRRGAVVNESD